MFNWLKGKKLPKRGLADLKRITRILFIDDNEFRVVNMIKESGWNNIKWVKDISSIDDIDLQEANILFIDIQGVGKQLDFKDEGLGLIKAIKGKYPEKSVIVYSSVNQGNRFHDGLSIADERISKDADPYQFISLVEKYSTQVFSLENCILRIQKRLEEEVNIVFEKDDIEKNLLKLYKKNTIDDSMVRKLFRIENVTLIKPLIELYLDLK